MHKVEQEIVAGVSPQAVWKILEQFGSVDQWAPGMRSSSLLGEQASGVGTRRIMRHRWGFRIEEEVTRWADGKGMSFVLTKAPFPMQNVHETWDIKEQNGATRIMTTVTYEMGVGVLGTLLDQLLVRFVVEREMRRGLKALIAYIGEDTPPAESEYYPGIPGKRPITHVHSGES